MSSLIKIIIIGLITPVVTIVVFLYFRARADDGCPACLAINAALAAALLTLYLLQRFLE